VKRQDSESQSIGHIALDGRMTRRRFIQLLAGTGGATLLAPAARALGQNGPLLPARNLGLHLHQGAPLKGPSSAANPYLPTDMLQNLDVFVRSLADRLGFAPPYTPAEYRIYPEWLGLWSQWGSGRQLGSPMGINSKFPSFELLNGLRDRGIIPLITWQPSGPIGGQGGYGYYRNLDTDSPSGAAPNAAILAGDYDGILQDFADGFIEWQGQLSGGNSRKGTRKRDSIIVRFAHEMNEQHFPWANGRLDGYPTANDSLGFQQAWAYVAGYLKSATAGASGEIRMLWCPSGSHRARAMFPVAASSVDYLGFDTYNWLDCSHPTHSISGYTSGGVNQLQAQVATFFDELADLGSPGTPFIIGEYGIRNSLDWCPALGASHGAHGMSPARHANDNERSAWLAEGLEGAFAVSPRIQSFGYFNIDMTTRPITAPQGVNWELGLNDTVAAYASASRSYGQPFDIP
jgi:hypothetical protein